MLNKSQALMERELVRVREKLDAMVERETLAAIKRWNKMVPGYEFDVGCHDLCSFRYREIGVTDWVEIDHYWPAPYSGNKKLFEVVIEMVAYSDAYCGMDERVCCGTFGWINEE